MRRNKPKKAAAGGSGQVRIIGGRWRGTRLPVVDAPGLRPTGDRARETLFNWLAPVLPGAQCLDLFSGTGVLGLEALSRGAAHCTLIDSSRAAVDNLRQSIDRLKAQEVASLVRGDALAWLARGDERFDVVFVDPPYRLNLWHEVAEKLADRLTDRALVYFETPVADELALPAQFELIRQKSTAMVQMRLFRWSGNL